MKQALKMERGLTGKPGRGATLWSRLLRPVEVIDPRDHPLFREVYRLTCLSQELLWDLPNRTGMEHVEQVAELHRVETKLHQAWEKWRRERTHILTPQEAKLGYRQ